MIINNYPLIHFSIIFLLRLHSIPFKTRTWDSNGTLLTKKDSELFLKLEKYLWGNWWDSSISRAQASGSQKQLTGMHLPRKRPRTSCGGDNKGQKLLQVKRTLYWLKRKQTEECQEASCAVALLSLPWAWEVLMLRSGWRLGKWLSRMDREMAPSQVKTRNPAYPWKLFSSPLFPIDIVTGWAQGTVQLPYTHQSL